MHSCYSLHYAGENRWHRIVHLHKNYIQVPTDTHCVILYVGEGPLADKSVLQDVFHACREGYSTCRLQSLAH